VKPQSAPGAASQLKLDGVKSAPQGAGQYKENSPDQQKTDTGKNGLIGLLTPAGAAQIKIDGKTSPQGAQQLKIEGKTAPQAGQ
jgi:hypothetical protein